MLILVLLINQHFTFVDSQSRHEDILEKAQRTSLCQTFPKNQIQNPRRWSIEFGHPLA